MEAILWVICVVEGRRVVALHDDLPARSSTWVLNGRCRSRRPKDERVLGMAKGLAEGARMCLKK